MMLKNMHSQEFTDFLNTMDDDIKWMTEGEVVTGTEVRGTSGGGGECVGQGGESIDILGHMDGGRT